MTKFFKKPKKKKTILEPLWLLFAKIWAKNEFSWKKVLCRFYQCSNYLPLCQKSEKLNEPFLRKLLDENTKNKFISLTSL